MGFVDIKNLVIKKLDVGRWVDGWRVHLEYKKLNEKLV